MSTLLVRHAKMLVTMDDAGTETADGGLFARDGVIEQVGSTSSLPSDADQVIDASGMVILPGLVNTHHHLYQTLTRAVPGAQNAGLFDWLRTLYPIWAKLTPDSVRTATTLGLAELALSGCTTAFDQQYLWPNGSSIDDQFEGAEPVGIRFVASRGSMSLGESAGGLPPDSVVEDESAILEDSQRAVEQWHDPAPGSMRQVVLSPCSPFSVTTDLMRSTAELARQLGVRLHTHLAETFDEEEFCLERFGARPVAYAEQVGWLGPDVWFAHGVHIGTDESELLAGAGTGVAHCPTSNMRLASGIAPVLRYLEQGVPVGLGVDGSASNDSSNMLAEVRLALLLARLSVAPGVGAQAGESGSAQSGVAESGVAQMTVRQALRLATRGGADLLGRSDIGSLEPGKACDFVGVSVREGLAMSGFVDPVAALVLGTPSGVDLSVVGGRRVVDGGEVVGIEVERLRSEHSAAARALVG